MRKYFIGCLIGFVLSIGVGAHAEVVNMIGKVVDGTFAVKVSGETLDTQAITIEGTSYLPVRAIGDAIGYNVGFDANMGITLTPKAITPSSAPITNLGNPNKYQELKAEADKLTKQIEDLSKIIEPYEEIGSVPDKTTGFKIVIKEKDELYTTTKKQRDDLITKRDGLEAQMNALQAQQ